MPIISVRDNENSRWKTNAKNNDNENNNKETNKDRKEQGGTEAIMKGSELNDFVEHLS